MTKKQYYIEYRKNNLEKERLRQKVYYQKNKEKVLVRTSAYAKIYKNRPGIRNRLRQYDKDRKQVCLLAWEGFIPKETNCQCCDKKIIFNCKDITKAIHFDHRRENATGIISPSNWLAATKRTKETEKQWEAFDFGLLCHRCNASLPTKNRILFLEKALIYAKT